MRNEPRNESDNSYAAKCENILQLGGLRTGTLDFPNPLGGQSCRVAHVNTGSGLRLLVLLDRGADLGEATFNDTNLSFLSANDYAPPSPAYNRETEWLRSWPGGMLTTGGPGRMGEARYEEGENVPLHGRFSQTPAAIVEVVNPDRLTNGTEMRLTAIIRDTKLFGPLLEVRRTWRFQLGLPIVHLEDVVTNVGDETTPHGLLYHINFGYPLLDEGARFIFAGKTQGHCLYQGYDAQQLSATKMVPAPQERFRGAREGLLVVEPKGDDDWVRAGLINERRQLAMEIAFSSTDFPRMAHWQHFAPRGCYAAALEPFSGSLFGLQNDSHSAADLRLAPGQQRTYRLRLRILQGEAELAELRDQDEPLE
ncbi:aldose 1-epimerase family protein [Blastopirellula sp. J2-11]|uniref:aldose 1-epimerase family protein n=1 Tax=Blastopirellula sp. J2-11 TaxID=2943192 RepID=UPI0021C7888B|nr:aldose 1-epimerase family protein [Blastopirellula sp. J2-11]UUO04369.1 aldose 1-epimerase family protein [Blastopirellula sp. J2-11]